MPCDPCPGKHNNNDHIHDLSYNPKKHQWLLFMIKGSIKPRATTFFAFSCQCIRVNGSLLILKSGLMLAGIHEMPHPSLPDTTLRELQTWVYCKEMCSFCCIWTKKKFRIRPLSDGMYTNQSCNSKHHLIFMNLAMCNSLASVWSITRKATFRAYPQMQIRTSDLIPSYKMATFWWYHL